MAAVALPHSGSLGCSALSCCHRGLHNPSSALGAVGKNLHAHGMATNQPLKWYILPQKKKNTSNWFVLFAWTGAVIHCKTRRSSFLSFPFLPCTVNHFKSRKRNFFNFFFVRCKPFIPPSLHTQGGSGAGDHQGAHVPYKRLCPSRTRRGLSTDTSTAMLCPPKNTDTAYSVVS